jgi:hypothetical protein
MLRTRNIVLLFLCVLLTVVAAAALVSSMYTSNGTTFLYAGVFLCLAGCCSILESKL